MSIHSSARILTILGLSLATTSMAFARTPPALARSQGHEVTTSGYRDSLARFEKRTNGIEAARGGAGYRDSLTRFSASKPTRVAAQR